MSEEFKVEIVNPEKSFFSSENVTEVIVPAFEGEMGILKDHISIISFLKPGIIKIFSKNVEEKFYVDDGIVEFKDNNLSVLTSSIFNLKDFDKVRNIHPELKDINPGEELLVFKVKELSLLLKY
jgi:F-type H+-transporting ATPase subunit epsilon/F-type H+-transporting ATPase subunit delta